MLRAWILPVRVLVEYAGPQHRSACSGLHDVSRVSEELGVPSSGHVREVDEEREDADALQPPTIESYVVVAARAKTNGKGEGASRGRSGGSAIHIAHWRL